MSTVGSTQAITQADQSDLAARLLGTHAIADETSRTLFFRFCYSEVTPELPVEIKVGLSEKTVRFAGDWVDNIGTYISLVRQPSAPLKMQAISGIAGTAVDAAFTFQPGRSYDVWIDIINKPLGETDQFTVHVAPSGGSRITVFENFDSDREPGEAGVLGFPRSPIDTVFLVSSLTPDQGPDVLAFDDFYISPEDNLLATAPVPSAFGKGSAGRPVITSLDYDESTNEVTITWNSSPGSSYNIETSETLEMGDWNEIEDGIPSAGATTTLPLNGTFSQPNLFFRVVRTMN